MVLTLNNNLINKQVYDRCYFHMFFYDTSLPPSAPSIPVSLGMFAPLVRYMYADLPGEVCCIVSNFIMCNKSKQVLVIRNNCYYMRRYKHCS